MAPRANRSFCIGDPVFYFLVDCRQYRRTFCPYKKPDSDKENVNIRSYSANLVNFSLEKRVVVLRAKVVPQSCFPNKVKKPDSTQTWRRRDSKHKNQKRLYPSSPPTRPRPTVLLPPMQWNNRPYGAAAPNSATTAPVVSTTVQDHQVMHTSPLPQSPPPPQLPPLQAQNEQRVPPPSAPSPGEIFYNSEDQSDIAFIVGAEREVWRFPAHSFIIGKMSATLQALLKSSTKVSNSDGCPVEQEDDDADFKPPLVLRLTNVQPKVFEQMLRYIYTHQVSLSSIDSSLLLLHPAQAYHLPELTSRCLSYISSHVTPSDALKVISHFLHPCISDQQQQQLLQGQKCAAAECHHNDNMQNELLFQCFQLVDRHADMVLQSEDFETLEHEIMVEVVKRDTLGVSSESVVFDALMRWACRACKRQRRELTPENKCLVLGKALFLVRYLLMSQEDFLRGPVAQGIFSKEDKDVLLSRISYKPEGPPPPPLPDHWLGWKISESRQSPNFLSISSPSSDVLSSGTTASTTPTGSLNKSNNSTERKKKSMSKKFLNGVGDLVICVIHMLD